MLRLRAFLFAIVLTVAACQAHQPQTGGVAVATTAIRVDITTHFQFEIDGRKYEAVAYLSERERTVLGRDALARVPDAVGENDWRFLTDHLGQFPDELRHYILVTNRRDTADERVSIFGRFRGGWGEAGWSNINHYWGLTGEFLILRRIK